MEEKSKNVRALYARSEASYFPLTYDFSNPSKLVLCSFFQMRKKRLRVTQLNK